MRKMGGVSESGKSGKRAGKRRRVQTALLAAALGFGAFAAFAQSEAPREWKSRLGKTVVTGTLDVDETFANFPSGAEKPETVYFSGSDGKRYRYRYSFLADADKKRVDVALGLTAEVVDGDSAIDAPPANGANSATDATPTSGANSVNGGDSRGLRPVAKCVRRAVLVGVSDYAEFKDLRFAGADVELMRSRLVELGFAPEHIVALTTEAGRENTALAPNKRNIERELGRILAESGPDDMIFVMFTGHGFQTDNFGGYKDYVGFAPSDAASSRATDVDFGSTVSLSKLFDDLKNSEAKFKWVLVDACRENLGSGAPAAGGSAASKSLPRGKALRKLEAPSGVAILQSCADGEFSWEFEGHGVFTRTFAESLTEVGDANEDGEVTFLEAAERTIAEVKRETAKRAIYETTQTPYLSGNMTNFVLADVKTAEAKERWLAAVEARESGDYATALEEIDAALALMPEKPEYATEKRTIEAFAEAERKAREAADEAARAAAEKARREAESAAQAERERLEREHAAALAAAEKAKEEAEKAKSDAERKAKEEAAARAEAERKAREEADARADAEKAKEETDVRAKAERLADEAMVSYYRGDRTTAIAKMEEALSLVENANNRNWLQRFLNEASRETSELTKTDSALPSTHRYEQTGDSKNETPTSPRRAPRWNGVEYVAADESASESSSPSSGSALNPSHPYARNSGRPSTPTGGSTSGSRLVGMGSSGGQTSSPGASANGDWSGIYAAGTAKSLTIKGLEYKFHYCPAGSFTMGSPTSENYRYDETQHRVELTNGFWMLETEVTQAMWKSLMGSNLSYFSSSGNGSRDVSGLDTSQFPVECVTWNDCQEFIEKLNFGGYAPSGFKFRLPTEAEWEYACRAGTTGPYAGSSLDSLGWYSGNSGGRPHEVGAKSANAWGLRDMHGNVWEWCADWYGSEYYEKSNNMQNPINVKTGSSRVLRGGSWYSLAENCRSANRSNFGPSYRNRYDGFRLALVRSSSSR